MRPKRLISLLVAVCMMITMLPLSAVTAFAEDTSTVRTASDGTYKYEYTINTEDGTATITKFLGPVNPAETPAPYKIEIPTTLGGCTVTAIGDNAFSNCYSLKTLSLGENIKTIGSYAFYDCTHITGSVTIPQSVTSIGNEAFRWCSGIDSLTINNAATSIGEWAFASCFGIKTLSLGEKIKTIGYNAFSDCSDLTNVTIPQSVTSIGPCAFAYCTSLKNITIPEKVTTIGDDTFRDCHWLEYIILPAGLTSFDDELTGCPPECVIYYNNDEAHARDQFGDNAVGDNATLAGRKFLCLCNVTFDANGGKFSGGASTATVSNVYRTENVDANKVPVPTRSGYQLAGWCTDPDDAENTMVDPTDIKPTASNVYGGVSDDLKLYAVWKAIPDHELTVKNGTFTYDNNAASDKGNVYEGALVTVTLDENNQLWKDSNLSFDHWDIQSEAKLLDENGEEIVNPGKTFTFVMPKEGVTIEAMPKENAVEDDGSDVLGTVAIIGTAAVGTAVLGYQAYCLGTEFAGKLLDLPYFPSNRSALALMLWEDAGKPMPESELLYPDVGQEEQDMDLQHAARWAMENGLIPDLNDEGTAAEEMKFYPNNAVSKIKVLKAWQKAQELKQNA